MQGNEAFLLTGSLLVTVAFFGYGFNIFHMLKLSKNYRAPLAVGITKPSVAIHLPIFNEKYVVERLLSACVGLADSYGKDLVRICILDDSDDETTPILEEMAASYRSKGFNMDVMHRDDRSGYKAGALNAALADTKEEFVVIFDSDFLPKDDFLTRAVAYVTDDSLGVVQFRWDYTNRDYNWVTKSVSIGMDAHFLVEQTGRYAGSYFLNFNGSAGIIRTKALRESGGWQTDTLAEDLDASYRIQMRHYRIAYVLDRVPCEVTPTVVSFKRQQGRWARGSLQVAKKLLPQILLKEDVNIRQKTEAFVHLTYYLVHPLMYVSFLLATLAAILNIRSITVVLLLPQHLIFDQEWRNSVSWMQPLWILFVIPILLCTVATWIYYVVTMKLQQMSILRNAKYLLVLALLGYGISISNSLEATKAFFLRNTGAFKRTPKYAVADKWDSWRDKKYQVPLDSTNIVEGGSIVLSVLAILRATDSNNYGIVPILTLYMLSFILVFCSSILQSGKEKSTDPNTSGSMWHSARADRIT